MDPQKLQFRNKRNMKTFTDKQNIKEFIAMRYVIKLIKECFKKSKRNARDSYKNIYNYKMNWTNTNLQIS